LASSSGESLRVPLSAPPSSPPEECTQQHLHELACSVHEVMVTWKTKSSSTQAMAMIDASTNRRTIQVLAYSRVHDDIIVFAVE